MKKRRAKKRAKKARAKKAQAKVVPADLRANQEAGILPAPLAMQPEEVDVLRPRKKMTVSEWALNRRVLSRKTSRFSGPWSHDFAPDAVEIMDYLSDPGTVQVTEIKCAQGGGTEIGLNFLGWAVDEDPGPTLIVMPREDDANRRVNTRIKPMFEATPSLRKHLPLGKVENINIGKETVLDNMILFIAWAGSPAALADNPIRFAIVDEGGKFPQRSGREANPVSLIKDRQTTYFGKSKLFYVTTPVKENDEADREFKAGDMHERWFKCPFCKKYHLPDWFDPNNFKFDHNPEGHLLEPKQYEAGGHARQICPRCKKAWTEKDRWQAQCEGRWVPACCTIDDKGNIVGEIPITNHHSFRKPAYMLYPGFMTISRMAAKWAEAILAKKTGDIGPLQDFYNSFLARSFEEREKETAESVLVSHAGGYRSGTVPAGVQMLTAGFDVQLDHIWYGVHGWGFMSEGWLIEAGRLETGDTSLLENYKLVEALLREPWPLEKGGTGVIFQAAIDCNYRPDVVKDVCVRNNDILIPVRGDDSVRSRVYRASKETVMLGGRPVNIIRYDLNTNVIKDRLYRLLYETDVPGPGYMHLPAGTTDEIFEQLASEEKRKIKIRGRIVDVWVLKGSRPNHIWDLFGYSDFVAQLAGARWLPDPNAEKPAPKKEQIRREGTGKIRMRY